MLPTSSQYKLYVYTQDYARHFAPNVLLKIIDPAARKLSHYSSSSEAFYADYDQLIDDNSEGTFDYGTLEDFFFLLNGTKKLMPNGNLRSGQYAWPSEQMSNELGSFEPELTLACAYSAPVTTVGRTLFFDTNCDSVPKDFILEYYRTGILLATETIINNTQYRVVSTKGVTSYDMLKLRIQTTTLPYRRVHLVEDIPGVYMEYRDKQVVSITVNQVIDVFSKEVTAGEVDFVIENASKALDILNEAGFEKYLQRRQPVEIKLLMVYPDDTKEAVLVGNFKLVDWKSQKGALTASFTARDEIDSLAQGEYTKGTITTVPRTLYELAEAVLIDAGVEKYTIDIQLMNMYTTAPLPIGQHKELLRLIAQAGQSIVITEADGSVHIKYISVLVGALNQVVNAAFNSDFNDWTNTNCLLDNTVIYVGKQSVKVPNGASLLQTIGAIPNHKLYLRTYVNPPATLVSGVAGMYYNDVLVTANFLDANLQPNEWNRVSALVTSAGTSGTLELRNASEVFNVDCFMLIDLTTTYGMGNEPTQAWCDQNIRFFENILMIPRIKDPAPQDALDYSILIDSPEIGTTAPTKAIETSIYSYRPASDTTDVYKGTRYINGTQEFTIKLNTIATDCVVTVASLNSSGEPTTPNTATLISSSVYAQAATLKVSANSEVQILVRGKAIQPQTSTYIVDNQLDANLIADSKTEQVDNKLITSLTMAEDVTSYAAYWYARRYKYDFDWRQNPAVENTDWVRVSDDFGKNNVIMLVERNIDYSDGVLGGNSRGVF